MRKGAFNSTAAQNFRNGTMEPQYAGVVGRDGSYYGAGGATEHDVPLQQVPLQREESGYGQSQDGYYAPPSGPPPQYGSQH